MEHKWLLTPLNSEKRMNIIKLTVPWFLAMSLIAVSCTKQPEEGGSLEYPVKDYPISEFTNVQSFQAEVVAKEAVNYLDKASGKTNSLISIILQTADGKKF